MSELLSESELLKRLGHKILIAGLAEAGKTATKRIFFLRQNIDNVSNLPATVNYERISIVINDVPVTVLDLGGQRIFLKRFLNKLSPFIFSNVKAFIFLIDVHNRSTRNSSIEYFSACIKNLQAFSPDTKCFVLFHKNDLVEKWPNYENIHEQFKEEFQLVSKQTISFFRTTIFRPETIVNSFGRIIELTLPKLWKSKFVDWKEIGPIEEKTEQFVTHREKIKEGYIQTQTPVSVSDDHQKPLTTINQSNETDISKVEKIQTLMTSALKSERNDDQTVEPLTKDKFISQTDGLIDQEPIPKESPVSIGITSSQDKISVQDPSSPESKINNLMNLSGITINQATNIVKSGYDDIFSLAITSGIPLKVTLDLFLNYIPLIKLQPGMDPKTLSKQRIMNIFLVFSNNIITETEIFDFLILSCENPEMNTDEVLQLVRKLERSRYETILIRIKGKESTQIPEFENKFLIGMATAKQEQINKLLLLNSDLQIEDAVNIIENNHDELYFLANQGGISFDLILEVLLRILPLINENGIDFKILSNQQIVTILQEYYIANMTKQDLENNFILAILNSGDKITVESNNQDRMTHLLQITNDLPLEIAEKLIDIKYERIFEQARIANIPLMMVLKILFKYIPSIKAEGFNTQGLDQQRILSIFTAHISDLIKEEEIKDCLTLVAIKPDTPVLEIIKNDLIKSKIQAIKVKEIEKVEKEIQPLPDLEGIGFKLEIQEENCLLTLFKFGKPIGNAMISPSIAVSKIIYLLTFELNLPFEMVNRSMKDSAEIIHKAIKESS
ncbi:MAG: ADP-ribosylation factor-like protein [Candidatus Hodarchaeales archaeon]